jgi:hypothetical protein
MDFSSHILGAVNKCEEFFSFLSSFQNLGNLQRHNISKYTYRLEGKLHLDIRE